MDVIFNHKWTKLGLTLVSCVLLTACSGKKEADLSGFHQEKKTETTQVSKDKGEEVKKGKEFASDSSVSQNEETTSNSVTTAQSSDTSTVIKQAGMDVQKLAKGDYSSIVGTWENYQGLGLIFDKSGPIALTKTYRDGKIVRKGLTLSFNRVEGEQAIGSLATTDSLYGIGAIWFVPAGVQTLGDKLTYQQDVILVGQSVNAEYEPFYKVSDSTYVPESVKVDENSISEGTSSESSNLAAAGTYTFTKDAPVRAKASLDATIDFTYSAGQSVYYDQTFVSEGKTWISYVSSSGTRRYVVID